MSVILYKNGEKLEELQFFTYNDSAPGLKTQNYAQAYSADTVVVTGHSLAEFWAAMCFMENSFRSNIKTLVLPFIPGARQDKTSPTGDILPTLKFVGKLINRAGFDHVMVLDPHSEQAYEHINNLHAYSLREIALPVENLYTGIVGPDKGSRLRASEFANKRELPVYVGDKIRNQSTGKIESISISVPQGQHLLIVDDICDGGGTFIPLGQQIQAQGSTADLYVTHGLFSLGIEHLKPYFTNIYTTDSINKRTDVIQIPVVEDMIKYAARNF